MALALLVLLTPAVYSYTTTMLQPSSLPLWPRSVEWLRAHHGNWLVDEVEHYYYSWKAPKKGGPQLTSLPTVGLAAAPRGETARRGLTSWPGRRGSSPSSRIRCPARGCGLARARSSAGRPPVLVTTFRTELDYPRIVAYVAWFDHTRTSRRVLPRPLRAAETPRCGGRCRCRTASGGGCLRRSTAASSTATATTARRSTGRCTNLSRPGSRRSSPTATAASTWRPGPAAAIAGPKIAFARQSLPLIVDHGRLNPALNDSSQWGFTLGNAVRVWRTGAGIDRRGNLIYAAADGQTVVTLAKILQRAGAVRAMQLDINPEWPTLITYTHHGGLTPTKVVPNYQQPATRYLVPDDRDFFAVYRRMPRPRSGAVQVSVVIKRGAILSLVAVVAAAVAVAAARQLSDPGASSRVAARRPLAARALPRRQHPLRACW